MHVSKPKVGLIFTSVLLLLSCHTEEPAYKIGMSINLSGRGGLAGEYIRDGALLAVREINEQGGIQGRSLRLIVKDDKNTTEGIRRADSALAAEGVKVIIGHSISQNTVTAYPYLMRKQILLITPYAATTQLTGKDDLFLRTCVDNEQYGRALAKLLKKENIKNIAFLQDISNKAFVTDYTQQCRNYFRGKTKIVALNSKKQNDWDAIMSRLLSGNPEAVMLLTEVNMTGLAAQKLRNIGYKGKLIGSLWCQTPDLIRLGGEAVEDFIIISFIDPQSDDPQLKKFTKKFSSVFNRPASARSIRSYELMKVLLQALQSCTKFDVDEIKKRLITGQYKTLMGTLGFDKYGDVIRPIYEIHIKNGKYKTVGILN
jgi:branched-chain amino acid transport system substrate-binding protein